MVERGSRSRYGDVIVINDYVLEAMPDLADLRHHSIPNPVDEVFFSTPWAAYLPSKTRHILQVGVISPRKNILESIAVTGELVRKGTDVHLNIVGPVVDKRYHSLCLNEIARLKLDSAVTFHGDARPNEVAALMDRADVLLLLSRQETAPMVVAEAHCRGLPVAVPRAFGLRWMVMEGVNGIFLEAPTAAENAVRLSEFLARGVDRDAIRRTAIARYELNNVIARTIEVYGESLCLEPPWSRQAVGG
jgi:glycosyltransferase involved in cell wall biosynthesis